MHFLIAIAIMPTLALPVLAGVLTRERLQESATGVDVERRVQVVAAMNRLRQALTAETSAGPLVVVADALHVPLATFTARGGWDYHYASLAEAEANTDKALAAIPRFAQSDPSIVHLRADLPSLRAAAHKSVAKGRAGMVALAETMNAYGKDSVALVEAEQNWDLAITNSAERAGGATLLASVRSFEAASTLYDAGGLQAVAFTHALLVGALSPEDRDALSWQAQRFHVAVAQLDTVLDPQMRVAWRTMSAGAPYRDFVAALARGPVLPDVLSARSGPIGAASVAAVLQVASTLTEGVSQISAFTDAATRHVTTVARTTAEDARRRAMLAVASTAAVVVLTGVALWSIGGILRSRLNSLTRGAARLSAGHLQPLEIQGPRELAAASQALNAAVATLQYVRTITEILARGELHSPELEQQAPGPLAAAVDESLVRIVTAARERAEIQMRLAHEASHDILTGLPNRAALHRALRSHVERPEHDAAAISVLFVDLDGFKACNDRYGHAAGDHILRVVAERLTSAARATDLVARLGGDEFVIVAENSPPGPETVKLGQQIVAAVSQPISYQGHSLSVGASVGVAGRDPAHAHAQATATVEQLLHEADWAVYQAKAAGRGRVVTYNEDSHLDKTGTPTT